MFDTAGKAKVTLLAPDDGPAGIFAGTPTRGFVLLTASDEENPTLIVSGPDGKLSAVLASNVLSLADGRVFLAAIKDGPSLLVLRDKEGKQIFSAP
jgi:hypothetical protein